MRREWGAAVLVLLSMGATDLRAAGTASAESREQIARRLRERPECCVIDARGELARMRGSIPFAVQLGSSVTVKKGAFALVVADTDAAALDAAREVARRSDGDAVAVNGGYATLQALGRASTSSSTAPSRFTIPSNTCEQGVPLQEFKH